MGRSADSTPRKEWVVFILHTSWLLRAGGPLPAWQPGPLSAGSSSFEAIIVPAAKFPSAYFVLYVSWPL